MWRTPHRRSTHHQRFRSPYCNSPTSYRLSQDFWRRLSMDVLEHSSNSFVSVCMCKGESSRGYSLILLPEIAPSCQLRSAAWAESTRARISSRREAHRRSSFRFGLIDRKLNGVVLAVYRLALCVCVCMPPDPFFMRACVRASLRTETLLGKLRIKLVFPS